MHLDLSKEQAEHINLQKLKMWDPLNNICWSVVPPWVQTYAGQGTGWDRGPAWRGLGLARWLSGEMSFNLNLKILPASTEEAKPKPRWKPETDFRQKEAGSKLSLYHLFQPNKEEFFHQSQTLEAVVCFPAHSRSFAQAW